MEFSGIAYVLDLEVNQNTKPISFSDLTTCDIILGLILTSNN